MKLVLLLIQIIMKVFILKFNKPCANKSKRKIKSGIFKIGQNKNKAALKTLKNILSNKNYCTSENSLWRKEVVKETKPTNEIKLIDPLYLSSYNQDPHTNSFVFRETANQPSMQNIRSQRYSSPENFINNVINEMEVAQDEVNFKNKKFENLQNFCEMYEDFYLDTNTDFVLCSTGYSKTIVSNKRQDKGTNNFLYNEDLYQKISFERTHHSSDSNLMSKKNSKESAGKLKIKSKTFLSFAIKQKKEDLMTIQTALPDKSMKRITIGHEVYKIGDLINSTIQRRASVFHFTATNFEGLEIDKKEELQKKTNTTKHMSILRKSSIISKMMEGSDKKKESSDQMDEIKSEFSGESSSIENSAVASGRGSDPSKHAINSTKLISVEDMNKEKIQKVCEIKPNSRRSNFQRVKSEID